MARIETWFDQDLKKAVKVQYIAGNVFSADNHGNVIGINVFDEGSPASLSGSVSGSVIRSDGATVAVTGTLSGNKVSVALPQSAYAIPGVISVVIKLTSGTDITTLGAVVGNVYRSTTDTVVDPGTIIPSVETLIAEIEAAVASIPADYSSLWESLAPAYSTSSAYSVGDYVTYNGGLYRCVSAITSGETWTAAHWVAVNVGGEVENLKNTLDITNGDIYEIAEANATAVSGAYTYVDCVLKAGQKYNINITASKPYNSDIEFSSVNPNGSYVDNPLGTLLANSTFMAIAYTPSVNIRYLRFKKDRSDSCIYTVKTYLSKLDAIIIKTDETYNRLAKVLNLNAPVDKNGYVQVSDGKINPTTSASRTDYIDIEGYTKIKCYDRITSAGYVLAYYDENFSILSSISVVGTDTGDSTYTIPSAAKYVIYSRYGTGSTYCILFNDDSMEDEVDDLGNRVTVLENVLVKPFRNFTILGDSFSTFNGYQNPTTNAYWYPNANNTLATVDQCWWHKFAKERACYLVQNNSFSGSPICYDGLGDGTVDAKEKSFVTRCRNLTNADLIIIEGATNDSHASMGSYKYSDWTESDFETFRPALAYVLDYCINHYVGSTVLFMLNNGLSNDIKTSVQTICGHYNVPLLELENISKESNHPNPAGMEQIKTQLINFLNTLN